MNEHPDIAIPLSSDEALVLFDLLYRLEETPGISVHPAEERVLWDIQAYLESILVEPFQSNYDDLLRSARERVLGS